MPINPPLLGTEGGRKESFPDSLSYFATRMGDGRKS